MYTLNDTKDFNDRPNNRYTFTYASNQDVDVLEGKVEDVQGSNIPLEGGKIPSNYLPTNTVQTGTDGKISSEVLPTNVVTLGADGLISSNQLPGFVDDVVEVESLPESGESGKIYIVTSGENVNKQYRWSGSQFVELTSGNIVIGEVTGTAYDGGKGKNLEDSLNNHVADTNVHVTTSEKELWNNKAEKTDIPDVSNFATTEQLTEVESKIPTDYVTTEELEEEINIVESQIPNDYASEDELAAVEAKIPDISNLATKEEVTEIENKIPTDTVNHDELNTVKTELEEDINRIDTTSLISEVGDSLQVGKEDKDLNLKTNNDKIMINSTYEIAKFSPYPGEEGRKVLQLNNHDSISGVSTTGDGANIAMLSKWDVMDFGSNKYPMNLNALNGEVKINDEKVIATTDQVEAVQANIPTDVVNHTELDEVEGKIPSVSSWALTDNEETIPAAKLPSFVDDIVEVSELPETGESGKIYLLIEGDQTTQYRWSGTQFVRIDHDSLVIGTVTGTALDGKIGTDHINNSDIHVTATDKETWNNKIDESALEPYALKTDLDSYTTKEEATEAHEGLELKITEIVGIPIRTGLNKKYTNEEIFGWFGVEDLASLKSLIINKRLALKYGIQLSGNPHYYNIPVQYAEFLDANTIHIIAIGLDTSNDAPSKYDITISLNETLITETSNIKVDIIPLDSEVDLSEYALKSEIPDVSDFINTSTLTSTVAEINNSVDKKITTETSDFITREEVQTELTQVEEKIPSIEGLATEEYVTGKINEVEGKIPSLEGYAKTSDIPDVSNFVTEDTLISTIQAETASTEKKIEVAVSGLATTIEVQSGLAEVEDKIPDISDLAKQTDNLSYNMGDFTSLNAASLKAADHTFYNNMDRRILFFTVNNTETGIIINNVGNAVDGLGYRSKQYLYYDEHRYTRYINRGTTGSVSYTEWVIDDGVTLEGKGVQSNLLFNLTTESISEDVKNALTYPNGEGVLTKDDLDACISKGMSLKDSEGNFPVQISKTRINSHYVFTVVDTSSELTIKSIQLDINDNNYSVFKNVEVIEKLDETKLPMVAKMTVVSSVSSTKIYSESEILGWFGFDDKQKFIDNLTDISFISTDYMNLPSPTRFYRLPIQRIVLDSPVVANFKTITATALGFTPYGKDVTVFTITANIDGSVIEGTQSNVKVEKETLVATSTFADYKKQMFGDIDVDKYTENTAYSAQFLTKLEQSYIDDLGNPDNIDGKPYDPETNKYIIDQPYLTWAYFDDTFTFHYDLYSKLHGGFFGDTLMSILGTSFTTNHMNGNKASAITSLDTSADNNAIIEKINELIEVLKERGVTL